MKVAMYLRKSRADEELEKTIGKGQTLVKHRKALLKVAKDKDLNIIEIKEEVVSADSLFFRPKMLELLREVEEKKYDGVLVMDIQRLGRGDTEDQGIITRIFKDSHTKIITHQKTYDLDDDYDEDYFEFESFMGRKEYKMIKKRMQGGRVRSVEDGNYIGTNPPLGYDISFIGKSRTLTPNKDADIIKLIFDMYVNQGMGTAMVATKLNELGHRSREGREFERTGIAFILKNLIYIGKVTWKKKEQKKSKTEGKRRDTRTRDKSEWIIADGKHEAIIDEELFDKAQEILKGKYHVPYQIENGIVNPLAGVVICAKCGTKMKGRPYKNKASHLICEKCDNKSSRLDLVENAIVNALEELYNNMGTINDEVAPDSDIKIYESQIENLNKELIILNQQKLKLFDLLEQGVYSNEVFVERANNISERINSIEEQVKNNNIIILKYNDKIKQNNKIDVLKFIASYKTSKNIAHKNELLKKLLFKVEYLKLKDQRNGDFTIKLFPRG